MVKLFIQTDFDIYEEVQIFPNLFESVFITKKEDRDLKITEILNEKAK